MRSLTDVGHRGQQRRPVPRPRRYGDGVTQVAGCQQSLLDGGREQAARRSGRREAARRDDQGGCEPVQPAAGGDVCPSPMRRPVQDQTHDGRAPRSGWREHMCLRPGPIAQAPCFGSGERGEHRTWAAVEHSDLHPLRAIRFGVVQHDSGTPGLPAPRGCLSCDLVGIDAEGGELPAGRDPGEAVDNPGVEPCGGCGEHGCQAAVCCAIPVARPGRLWTAGQPVHSVPDRRH